MQKKVQEKAHLVRRLSLPLLILYGLGVTVGAGIYVLVGETARHAGVYAPVSFIIAAIVISFTGFSYAELSTRYPVSAGEAAYVKNGFRSNGFSVFVGLLVVTSGVISAAAVSIGAGGYLAAFVDVPEPVLVFFIVILLGMIASWGIMESVGLAAVFTLIEVGGLFYVVWYGLSYNDAIMENSYRLIPTLDHTIWAGILSGALLAFFAFVGFEDIANVAEEVKDPTKNMPIAIILTLILATGIYVAVVSVVVLSVPIDQLANSNAPLTLIFGVNSHAQIMVFSGVAVIATVNGVLVQMIMASRVLYGLATQGSLPTFIGQVNSRFRTPVNATIIVVLIIVALALFLPIAELAKATSTIVLIVFLFVNTALILVKLRRAPVQSEIFEVPILVPILGVLTSIALLAVGYL